MTALFPETLRLIIEASRFVAVFAFNKNDCIWKFTTPVCVNAPDTVKLPSITTLARLVLPATCNTVVSGVAPAATLTKPPVVTSTSVETFTVLKFAFEPNNLVMFAVLIVDWFDCNVTMFAD